MEASVARTKDAVTTATLNIPSAILFFSQIFFTIKRQYGNVRQYDRLAFVERHKCHLGTNFGAWAV